jgi:hypothetical protein
MSKPLFRTVLFAAIATAWLAALPAVAAPAPQAQPARAAAVAAPASPSCSLDVADPFAVAAQPAIGALTLPEWLAVGGESLGNRFHGFCPCGCSNIPDCNTSADCFGGAPCRRTISCC